MDPKVPDREKTKQVLHRGHWRKINKDAQLPDLRASEKAAINKIY